MLSIVAYFINKDGRRRYVVLGLREVYINTLVRVGKNPFNPYQYDTRDHIILYHIDRFFLIRYQINK